MSIVFAQSGPQPSAIICSSSRSLACEGALAEPIGESRAPDCPAWLSCTISISRLTSHTGKRIVEEVASRKRDVARVVTFGKTKGFDNVVQRKLGAEIAEFSTPRVTATALQLQATENRAKTPTLFGDFSGTPPRFSVSLAERQPTLARMKNLHRSALIASATALLAAGVASVSAFASTGVGTATNPQTGNILVDDRGMTLYRYTQDQPNVSTCYNSCASAWPPVIDDAVPAVQDPRVAAGLSLTQRNDGSEQLTYNGSPLYYFVADQQPGDANGQASDGVWFVVSVS